MRFIIRHMVQVRATAILGSSTNSLPPILAGHQWTITFSHARVG